MRRPDTNFEATPILPRVVVNLRPAAVDDDDVDSDVPEQADVLCEARLQLRVDHGVAAVLDDEGAAVEAPDVRERLVENRCLLDDVLHAVSYPGAPTGVQDPDR